VPARDRRLLATTVTTEEASRQDIDTNLAGYLEVNDWQIAQIKSALQEASAGQRGGGENDLREPSVSNRHKG
jgi:predicted transcriptional regulator